MKAYDFLKPAVALGIAGQLLTGASASAQAPGATAPQTQAKTTASAPAKAPVQGLFWKATNGTNTVYLLGSIHLASKKMYPLPAVIEDGFKASKTLVVEVNINNIDQSKLVTMMQSKGLYPEGDDLLKHLQPGDDKKLEAFCDKNGFPLMAIQRVKPWLASLMISVVPFMNAGMTADLGIDQYFLNKAKATGKKVDEAENMDFQIDLLSSEPDAEALASLHQVLSQKSGGPSSDVANKLQDSWIRGDAEAVDKFAHADRDPSGKDRKLLEDRNPHMADVAEKYLKGTTPCFFVVGSAHLTGPEGVVAILQKRGYTVTQVLSPAK